MKLISLLALVPALAFAAPGNTGITGGIKGINNKVPKESPADRFKALAEKKLHKAGIKNAKVSYFSAISEDQQQTMSGVGVTVRQDQMGEAYKLLTGKKLGNEKVDMVYSSVRGVDLALGTRSGWKSDSEDE
jgi:hypothetical protein